MLPDKIQDDVVKLKELLEGSNLEYAKVLLKEGKPGFKPLAQSIVDNADTYMKQRYAAFNNAKYQYPKELEEKVTELMKNRILLNKDSRDIVKNIARIKDDLPLDKLKQDATFQAALNKQADQKLNFLKQNNIWDLKDIHLYIDKGFDEKINIQLWDKTFKQINEIKIGEKLINGEIVYGFVKLKNIECFSNNYKNTNKILYNLLTDKGTFIINNELIFDYNNCLNFE